MPLLGDVMVRFMADTAGFTSGAGLVVAGLVGVGAAIGESVHMAGDFQNAMLQNVAHAGLAKDQFDKVSQSVLQMAGSVGQAPVDMAKALYPIYSGLSEMTNQSAKAQVGLAELDNAAKSVAGTTTDVTLVSRAATSAFNALGLGSNDAGKSIANMNTLFDVMNQTVSQGDMTWSSYTPVVGKLAIAIKGTSTSFVEANAALATMTNQGISAKQATTYLAASFTTLDDKSGGVAKRASALGLTFDEAKFKTMDLAHQMDYLKEVTGGNSEQLLKLMNNNVGVFRTYKALETGMESYKTNLDAISHSQGATAASFATASQGMNASMDRMKAAGQSLMITMGSELLPIVTRVINQITPMIMGFIAWENKTHGVENAVKSLASGIGNMIAAGAGIVKFFQNNQVALSALEAVLVVVAGVGIMLFIQALVALGVAAALASVEFLPMIATIAVIALAITGIILLIKNWGAVMDWLTGKTKQSQLQQQELYQKNALKTIQSSEEQKRGVLANMEDERTQLIAKIKGMADGADKSREQIRLSALNAQINTTKGDLKELDNEKTQHLKILKDLQSQDPQIREQTKLAAIKKQVEQKDALLKTLDSEKTQLIAKILDEKDGSNKQRDLMKLDAINKQIATTTGTIKALTTEGTQHKQKLNDMIASDLEARKNWITRASDSLQAWGDDQLKKLNTTIQGWSNGLQRWGNDTLSNMNATFQGWGNGVQNWGDTTLSNLNSTIQGWGSGLQQWGNNTLSFLGGLAGDFASGLGGIANSAFQWGANIVQNIAAGIQNSIGAVISAAQNVANAIANFLPHSPAKEGPLSKLDEFGPALVHGIASGVDNSSHMLKSSMDHLFTPTTGTGYSASGTSGQGNGTQTIIIQMDGRDVAKALGPHLTNEIRLVAQVRR